MRSLERKKSGAKDTLFSFLFFSPFFLLINIIYLMDFPKWSVSVALPRLLAVSSLHKENTKCLLVKSSLSFKLYLFIPINMALHRPTF